MVAPGLVGNGLGERQVRGLVSQGGAVFVEWGGGGTRMEAGTRHRFALSMASVKFSSCRNLES